jgi:hypothetical protein
MKISMYIPGGSFQGDYSAGTTYRRNDIVRYLGHAFQATADNLSGVIPTTETHWKKIVNAPAYSGLAADTTIAASTSTTGIAAGTRKYWFGQEWALKKPSAYSVVLEKVYRNCNCNCNCVCNCDCVANQPNCGNCSYNAGDGLACNCACLFQSDCNYNSGNCNCTPNCADGNCYY